MKSRLALLLALVGVLSSASLALAQTYAPATTTSSKTLFLNREGCSGEVIGRLLPSAGNEPPCGGYGGVNCELFVRAGIECAEEFHSTTETKPIKLNAAKNVTGLLKAESYYGPFVPGVGIVTFDVELEMDTDKGSTIRFDPITMSQVASPFGPSYFKFSMPVPRHAIGAVVTRTSMTVTLRGVNYSMNILALRGDSYLEIPAKK